MLYVYIQSHNDYPFLTSGMPFLIAKLGFYDRGEGAATGLVGLATEPPHGWGSLFPLNAWESALPAACRPP